jgi:hypothetical protein
MRWAGHVAFMGEKKNAYRALVGKLEGKMPLGKHDVDGRIMLKCSQRNRMGNMDWFHLVQNRDHWLALVNMVMNAQVS